MPGWRRAAERLMMCKLRLNLYDEAIEAAEDYIRRTAGSAHEARAERLADSVTYLMERLALVEVVETSQQAQLRSAPPHRVDGAVEYYEAFLSREADGTLKVHLTRYRSDTATQHRTSVPLNLTREVLLRLLDDLAEVVDVSSRS